MITKIELNITKWNENNDLNMFECVKIRLI